MEQSWEWGGEAHVQKKFFPSTFFVLKVQWAILWWSVQFGQFPLGRFSTRAPYAIAQPFVKVGARAPVTYGIGAGDHSNFSSGLIHHTWM